ncbi:MAG: DsbA family oxidoreductase [Luteitalea sp.]|nr:DsbA family oxidoreductase [Luteitalea sp.]
MKIEIYSDIVCPWCYVGERRLDRALATLPPHERIDVVFRPYQLDPNAPETAVPLTKSLERRFGGRTDDLLDAVNHAAEGEGITIAWDRALSANTRTAHRLLQWALREGGPEVQRKLAAELFALHFTRGGNVADVEQLAAAAASVGLDAERARTYLDSAEGVRELDSEFDRARELGISSVPTFVIDGRYAIQGAQPVSAFVRIFEQVLSTRETPEETHGDSCTAGVCAT